MRIWEGTGDHARKVRAFRPIPLSCLYEALPGFDVPSHALFS